jgi:uncharacterized damage-inducible protein DinB
MKVADVTELFAYDAWANARVFEVAEALTPERLQARLASSFPSVRDTLGHLVGAAWIWLRRWRGESPAAPAWTRAELPEIRRQLAIVETDRAAFLAGLTDADFDRPFDYRNLKGEPQHDRLGGTLLHVVNHGTYHRGQVATQLRQLACTPPNTDLIAYLRLVK